MNDQSDASNNKPIPTPVPTGPGSTAAPGSLSAGAATGAESVSGSGTPGGPGMGAKMGTDSGSSGTSSAGQPAGSSSQRQDYSSSAGEDPGFEGTAASLESLPIGEAMHEMVDMARQFVREHPLAAVAGGVLVGMVLGRR